MTARSARPTSRAPASVYRVLHVAISIGVSCGAVFAEDGEAPVRDNEGLQSVILRFPEDRAVAQSLVPVKLSVPRVGISESKADRVVLPRELRQQSLATPQAAAPPVFPMPRAVQRRISRDDDDAAGSLLDLVSPLNEADARDDSRNAVFDDSKGWLAQDITKLKQERPRLGEQLGPSDIWDRSIDDPFTLELKNESTYGIRSSVDRNLNLPRLHDEPGGIELLPDLIDPLAEF